MSNNVIPYRGLFKGGNPSEFLQDSSACTDAQKENLATFCRLWNSQIADGETPDPLPAESGRPENSLFGLGYQGTFEVGNDDE